MSDAKILATGLYFGEGPRWHAGRLWFSDFYDHAVKSVDLAGRVRTELTIEDHPSGLGWLPDGRLLYTRWEYVDRSQVDYHHLWAANPDGTAQMVYYGNQKPGVVMIDSKPIPLPPIGTACSSLRPTTYSMSDRKSVV